MKFTLISTTILLFIHQTNCMENKPESEFLQHGKMIVNETFAKADKDIQSGIDAFRQMQEFLDNKAYAMQAEELLQLMHYVLESAHTLNNNITSTKLGINQQILKKVDEKNQMNKKRNDQC